MKEKLYVFITFKKQKVNTFEKNTESGSSGNFLILSKEPLISSSLKPSPSFLDCGLCEI